MNRHVRSCLVGLLLAASAHAGPKATLADLAWLQGSWEGKGIGGAPAVEVYSASAGGQMPGHFRQLGPDGSVQFYELIMIVERDGSLVYRVKHFGPDMIGWEEKDVVRDFPLIAVAKDRWEFSGIVYDRKGADRLAVSVTTKGKDDSPQVLTFEFRRKH